ESPTSLEKRLADLLVVTQGLGPQLLRRQAPLLQQRRLDLPAILERQRRVVLEPLRLEELLGLAFALAFAPGGNRARVLGLRSRTDGRLHGLVEPPPCRRGKAQRRRIGRC